MSVGESAFSLTEKNARGNLCTIRGNTYDEFYGNLREALGDQADVVLAEFAAAFGGAVPTPQQAVNNVVQAFPQAQPVVPVPGQPVPVPVQTQQAYGPAETAPPVTGPTCAHGPMTYRSTMGKDNKPWNRWECAIPWSRNAQGRCANVNVR